jgi:hypothetical protein
MNQNDIAIQRLFSQQIATNHFKTVKDTISWLGAMQAQDYAMAKWAIGVRLQQFSDEVIEKAFNNGEIIRTHVLRPTWHFVSADDISWMLELTAPRIIASSRSRHKQLGLTGTILSKSNKIIEKALADRNYLTRNELKEKYEKAKIPTDGNRLSHLLMHAELEKLICSGPAKGKQLTYALFDERVPKKEKFIKEDALGKLAQRYFSSHFPATFQDFVWWSGLTVAEAKQALELVKSEFILEKIGEQVYWFPNTVSTPKGIENADYLLPAFDEFIISYKDRSASIIYEKHEKLVSYFGVFRPIIVENGIVTGVWKRTVKKDKVIVDASFFKKPGKDTLHRIEKAAETFGNFLNKKTDFTFCEV